MSHPDPFESPAPAAEKKGLSGCAIAGIGCGIAALVLVILIVLGVLWVRRNVREFGTDIATAAMKDGLEELDIPDDQLQRIHARIDNVGQQFKDGELNMEQVGSIFEKIGEGPLMPAGVSLFVKRAYLQESGLTEDEKAAGDITIQRFARGVIDESISESTRKEVIGLISTTDAQGQQQFKEELTDDELRAFLSAAKTAADDAGIPEDVPEIDFADEFDKAVDAALAEVDNAGE